ncbi:Pyrophosphate-energized vacuolar membrane proton pump [Hordeum vulgare]|nr:Pyrophosphate-energized vacuolar membrane proton pump [Hordeum vulgare]
MAEAEAAEWADAQEEAICTRILKKRQRRNTRALTREQNRAVREMIELPPKEENDVSSGEDSSGDEQNRLDPYCIFDWYPPRQGRQGRRE